LFERVLPRLANHGAHFKIAADRDVVLQLNAGGFGETQIGKVVTVYPRDDKDAVALAQELIERTRDLPGPAVTTDLHLGAAVYARYGAVLPRIVYDRFGNRKELIPSGTGEWVSDSRTVPFTAPHGIANPFHTALPVGERGQTKAPRLLRGRFLVTDVLHPGLAGSVLRAIDTRALGGPSACVLKQARPHCSEDQLGRDRRTRLRHEGLVLKRLQALRTISHGGRYFEDEGIGYLPLNYIQGQRLTELAPRLVNDRPWQSLRAGVRCRLLDYGRQLVRSLQAAHALGVIHRDVSPNNVWIGDDGRVCLLDWECAHLVRGRTPPFLVGTPGFSDSSREESHAPSVDDDWLACARVLAFVLTGLDPEAVVHGTVRELTSRLEQLTGVRELPITDLLARTLADEPVAAPDADALLRAITATLHGTRRRRERHAAPVFTSATHEAVLAEGLETLTVELRSQLSRLRARQTAREATAMDAHGGIAGLLYVLAAAQLAGVTHSDGSLAARAVRVLTDATPVIPNLPGLVHGHAGRALAVAGAVEARWVSLDDARRAWLGTALAGRLDWPDFTHGAAGQGFAALTCANRLGAPELATGAQACAAYLVQAQDPDGAWALPAGVPGASGERFTGFAHGAAGMMAFLGSYAALAGDPSADAAWRRAETWLISRARRGRGGRWQWPLSDRQAGPWRWWCHGAPGIALGWLIVARAQGTAAISEEHLRRALAAWPANMRSHSLGQCHGLAGVGEVYLEAHRVLGDECWRDRAEDIANVLVALCRRRRSGSTHPPWLATDGESANASKGLMLGTAGILHYLLRYRQPAAPLSPPLLG